MKELKWQPRANRRSLRLAADPDRHYCNRYCIGTRKSITMSDDDNSDEEFILFASSKQEKAYHERRRIKEEEEEEKKSASLTSTNSLRRQGVAESDRASSPSMSSSPFSSRRAAIDAAMRSLQYQRLHPEEGKDEERPQDEERAPQQHPRQQDNSATAANSSGTSGLGQWQSWTRLFTDPLLALLDLLDNAFDAATVTAPKGCIQIARDVNTYNDTTGIVVYNSSFEPVRPQEDVLARYVSHKGETSAIGENGIGLNQGCAALTDLAFTLSKNTVNGQPSFGMGILALQLQTDQAPNFPPFQFQATSLPNLKQEMMSLFTKEGKIGNCIRDYGNQGLEAGVDRLIRHFEILSVDAGWNEFDHAFALIIHRLRHGKEGDAPDQRVKDLLKRLSSDLPMRYLHIPSSLSVKIKNSVVNFNFWQPRLVEMAQFDLLVNKDIPLQDDNHWKDPSIAAAYLQTSYHKLRIYVGFDALRVNDDKASKTACLYIYSRESGRLIERNTDARDKLGLSNGGTEFCQGLTIIVDDKDSALPLNPAKQGLGFAEEPNGAVHERNLRMWVGAATRLYYNFLKERVCAKSKENLTKAVRSKVKNVKSLVSSSSNSFRSLSSCEFDSFDSFASCLSKDNKIRLVNMKKVELRLGSDTKLKIPRMAALPANPRKRKAPVPPQRAEAQGDNVSDRRSEGNGMAISHVLFERSFGERVRDRSGLALSARDAEAKHSEEIAAKDSTTIKQLRSELRRTRAKHREEISAKDATIAHLRNKLGGQAAKAKQRISRLREEIGARKKEIDGLKQTIEEQRGRIDQILSSTNESEYFDNDGGDSDDIDEDIQKADI